MCDTPSFLPPMLNLDGTWEEILGRLYSVFSRDFKQTATCHNGLRVFYNRTIKLDGSGKEEGFWHVVSKEAGNNGVRNFDHSRAKRLPWAKPLIETSGRTDVKIWQYNEGTMDKGVRTYIWLEDFDYVLILARKKEIFYWITAFYVESWKKSSLQRKYEKRVLSNDSDRS